MSLLQDPVRWVSWLYYTFEVLKARLGEKRNRCRVLMGKFGITRWHA